MFCIIAFIVLSILSIFSASHRALAKESFECVFRRITLRPCDTGFKEKIQSKIIGGVLTKSVTAARILNNHFELISWIFFILMTASTAWVIYGGYNFYMYGSCNGLNASGFCVFDPHGSNNKVTPIQTQCSTTEPTETDIHFDKLTLDTFQTKNVNSPDHIIFVGCYSCEYSHKAYPEIENLVKKTGAHFTFVHFPVKEGTQLLSSYAYCAYQEDQQKFWNLNRALFNSSENIPIPNEGNIENLIRKAGLSMDKIKQCANDPVTKQIVDKQVKELEQTGIYGTPTISINGKLFVGPKPARVYTRAIAKHWWQW